MAAYSRVTLNALLTRLTERLGDNSTFWTTREKRAALNEALRVWAVMTGQWSQRHSIPTVAGQIFYDVPRQMASLQRMKYNSTPMYQSSLVELDCGYSNWQNAANGAPFTWAPVGLDKVAIYPPSAAGSSLSMEGLALTQTLNVGGDFIDIGDEELTRVLDYAHHVCCFKEGGLEFEASFPLMSGFVDAAVQRNQRLLGTAVFKRYAGLDKAQEQRPVRSTEQTLGARG